jgi:23S rRNA (uracil1939-C5)-methyltransferase
LSVEFELDVTALGHDGRGIGRREGKAVFVSDALPGERVRAVLTRKHRDYDEAQCREVLIASPDRVVPECPHFGVCGGCVLQHLAPSAQIAAKQQVLLDNLARIGKVEPLRVLEPLTGTPWGYRRRARLSVKHVHKKGRVLVGFRERDGRHVADLRRCLVLDPSVGERLEELAVLIDAMEGRDGIPQLEVSVGEHATVLTVRHMQPLSAADVERWRGFSERSGIAILSQSGGPDSVVPVAGDASTLSFQVEDGLELRFEPLDFVQVNAAMNARMVRLAIDLLAPEPGQTALDLFCGLGNFTLPLARRVASVVGVEGEGGLVERARANAQRNGVENASFVASDLFQDQRNAPWAVDAYDLLLLDPPRAGAKEVLEYLPRARARRLVYVSCHPASLARDAGILAGRGFRLEAAGVMDMFPHTAHVESIALFVR